MLKVRNLWKYFHKNTPNETRLFTNLSLDVEKGEFISIIGSNGAGKSTLLNIIAGTVKEDRGTILLENEDITNLKEHERSQFIGRVYQNPSMGTVEDMTVLENLSLAMNKGKPFNLTKAVSPKNIPYFKELLASLSIGLEEKLNTKVGMLSGGQRQSLTVLMSTLSNPKLLLLDEHTAALDPKTSERVMQLTDKLVKERNMTALMVTHNLYHAIEYGNRLLMLHEGEIIIDISGEEKKKLTIEKLLKMYGSMKDKGALSDRLLLA